MVLVLTAAPAGLRGDLTKWLFEISPGVFVGNPSRRIRDSLWEKTKEHVASGRAILVYSSNNEQRLKFDVHQHSWEPVDFEGLTLMRRPTSKAARDQSTRKKDWSLARARHKSLRPSWRKQFE